MTRILVVCTANVCRSAMAAALLDLHCSRLGVAATVSSAGTQGGIVGSDPDAITVMAERGIDIAGHRPRRLNRTLVAIDGADLILAMTREHLRHVSVLGRGVFPRVFTIKELVRRSSMHATETRTEPEADDARAGNASPGAPGWLAAVGSGRTAASMMGDDPADDIADPYGISLGAHRRTADELDALTASVAASLRRWSV